MNTQESDMEQMKFAREWVRAHAAKKMAKYEKKLRRAAKDFFGHPVTDAAIYDINAHIDHIANVLSEETGLNIVAGPVTVNGDGTIEVMQPIIMFPNGRFGLLEYAFGD